MGRSQGERKTAADLLPARENGWQEGKRGVRTYARRGGRLTPSRRQVLSRLLPRFEVAAADRPLLSSAIFGGDVPLHVEIGCGYGEAVLYYARQDPAAGQVAVEVYRPGIAALLQGIEVHRLANVRIVPADACQCFSKMFAAGSLSGLRLFYPDPWPKKRHAKRRLVNAQFLAMVRPLMRPDGIVAFATDSVAYFQQAIEAASEGWEIVGAGSASAARADRPVTRFEQRASKEGRQSLDLRLRPI